MIDLDWQGDSVNMISKICPGGKRIVVLSVLSIDRDDTFRLS